jgi:hypothetical protein
MTAERVRRLSIVRRHHLGAAHRAASPAEVIASLGALHSSDPATVYLSIAARCPSATLADIDAAVYDGGHLRVLGMRRTMFVVPVADVAAVHASSTRKIAVRENVRLVKYLADNELGGADPAGYLSALKSEVLDALRDTDGLTGRELGRLVPDLQQKITVPGGQQGMTTMVLQRMPMDGTIVRGRPIGTWLSSQYRYSVAPGPHGIDDPSLSVDEASREVLGGYARRFGPVNRDDHRWWTGWTATQVDRAAEGLEFVDHVNDSDGELGATPAVAVLPGLDSTIMGWRDRDWYLGELAPALFDRNGNAGPTLLVDGRVVGGWAQDNAGAVVYRLLEPVSDDARSLIDAECLRIEAWLDGAIVTPRFRTPLERELSGR